MSGLPDLDSNETLGRTVVSSKAARRVRRTGIMDIGTFLERAAAPSVSVDRLDHASSTTLGALAQERAAGRTPPRQFRGWAILPVRVAGSRGRTVEATPLEGNPYHADIVLPLADRMERDRRLWHAADLAARSSWREAP